MTEKMARGTEIFRNSGPRFRRAHGANQKLVRLPVVAEFRSSQRRTQIPLSETSITIFSLPPLALGTGSNFRIAHCSRMFPCAPWESRFPPGNAAAGLGSILDFECRRLDRQVTVASAFDCVLAGSGRPAFPIHRRRPYRMAGLSFADGDVSK